MAHFFRISKQEDSQAVRLHRHSMAALTSLMVLGLLFVCYLQDFLTEKEFIRISFIIGSLIIGFYLLFRTGLNHKFSDPSLTLLQMVAASLTILYAMYAANGARSIFAIVLVMIFIFGVFRYERQGLLIFSVFLLASYLGVIGLLSRFKPDTIDISIEITQWLVVTLTLPWFAMMGGYISALRAKLKKSNTELKDILKVVQASQNDLEETQHIAKLGGWRFDVNGDVKWSQETFRIFGLKPTDKPLVGDEFWQIVYEKDRVFYRGIIEKSLGEGNGFEFEFRIQPQEGNIRWLHSIGHSEYDTKLKKFSLHGTVMDITERKVAADALKNSEARFRSLTALSSDWYWEQDEHFILQEIAGSTLETTRIQTEMWIGKSWFDVIHDCNSPDCLIEHKERLAKYKSFDNFVFTASDIDGKLRYLSASGIPFFSDSGAFKGYRGVTKDITFQYLAEERIRQLAHYDDLTGLANRPLFCEILTDRITKARRQNTKLAILFIDLDGFKQINDKMGHAAGDQLLKIFADRLRLLLRRSDAVARFAGDEFVVLIDDFSSTLQIEKVANKIIDSAIEPFLVGDNPCFVTASVGIAMYPNDGEDNDSLIKQSDAAMYKAKQQGKNNYHFYSKLTDQALS